MNVRKAGVAVRSDRTRGASFAFTAATNSPISGRAPTRHEVGAHVVRVVVEHAHSAAPELAAAVDIGAEVQQRIDHRSIVAAEDDGRGGVEGWTVDRGAQLGLLRQQSTNRRHVAGSDGFLERLHPPFILVPGPRLYGRADSIQSSSGSNLHRAHPCFRADAVAGVSASRPARPLRRDVIETLFWTSCRPGSALAISPMSRLVRLCCTTPVSVTRPFSERTSTSAVPGSKSSAS